VKRVLSTIRVVAIIISRSNLLLFENDQDFTEDQWVRNWSEVVKKYLVEVIQVALL
jgi:hypothetical protein